ncbi:gluconate 2-dehydrogenase subunit 3 family protein [Halalkalirubrum salinum]|uniref:gluconate 2-dehydrogenase subunit 3 family protein n=1 Tax=Halalkalirubrum salinum TaxID=2563889 RepID=UPI0010FB10FD|nr:gluconate 2-dehydrogenase subunit 3 family protein [Halalkalirubrum salinum]
MQLTRRDATAALAALGATGGIAYGARHFTSDDETDADDTDANTDASDDTQSSEGDDHLRSTLVAVAGVLYPNEVEGIEGFVNTFLDGRLDDSPHAEGVRSAIQTLDEHAEAWYNVKIVDMESETIDGLLREIGADTADEDPNGPTAERIRYYVVNELLLALFTSPTGGELVGIENPIGHAGGLGSYTQGPGGGQ